MNLAPIDKYCVGITSTIVVAEMLETGRLEILHYNTECMMKSLAVIIRLTFFEIELIVQES